MDGNGSQHGRTDTARVTAWVSGRVQGVGFRWWVRERASALGLDGSATNLPDRRVEVVAEGPRDALEQLVAALSGPGTPGSVSGVATRWAEPQGVTGFTVR